MRIYLGGHLNFYHPRKEKWLAVEINRPTLLIDILNGAGIPLGEVHLVVVDGEMVEFQDAVISANDEVKLFSAVGGG